MKRHINFDNKYIAWGITAFVVIACAIIFYMMLQYVGTLHRGLRFIIAILSPFIWGMAIAYLLSPAMDFNQRKIFDPLLSKVKNRKLRRFVRKNTSRGLSIALAEIIMIAVIATLVSLVLPQMYNSIQLIIINSPIYYEKIIKWLENLLKNYPVAETYVTNTVGNIGSALSSWVSDQLLPRVDNIIFNVTSSVIYVLKGLYNAIIGIIVSIYVLNKREKVLATFKKIIYSLFSIKNATRIRKMVVFTDDVFRSFISGKLLDSAIIGVLCYIFCLIAKMPYALLIAVIVGLTNIIPFFGPFIGAIPSFLLILMISPSKALIFLIFIFVLQQFDGNILGPYILGDSTGVGGFWVLFSIILGAGLFGFWGMLLGVPVWVILYTGMQKGLQKRLIDKGLPPDTESYYDLKYIDENTNEFIKENKK